MSDGDIVSAPQSRSKAGVIASSEPTRDTIFISKATPGDDAFVLWLAPRLEAAGYKVFADIFDLDAGDEWRGKLTAALQTRAVKMLLCCSDETLARRGVKEEIAIAEDLTKQLGALTLSSLSRSVASRSFLELAAFSTLTLSRDGPPVWRTC
jgi:hypothetical protein